MKPPRKRRIVAHKEDGIIGVTSIEVRRDGHGIDLMSSMRRINVAPIGPDEPLRLYESLTPEEKNRLRNKLSENEL